MTFRRWTWAWCAAAIFSLCAVVNGAAQAPLQSVQIQQGPQQQQVPSFLADKYDVSAYLDTVAQGINAVAKVEFRAQEVSQIVRVELHENLEVRDVKGGDGKVLPFQREPQNPLYLVVTLPSPVPTGQTVSLTFTYGGLLANEENSPVPNIRMASVNKDWSYLLLPGRWFPLTNFPSNRYSAIFKLNVPDTVAVAGTGKAEAPQPMPMRSPAEGKRLMYTFHGDKPEPYGSFVIGPLQLNPKEAENINVAVYAPPAQSTKAQEFANEVAHQEVIFSDMFGELPEQDLTVVQLPDGTLRDFAGPGVVMLSHRIWDPKISDRILSQLVASQWWGVGVLPASTADVWITDGLARYSEELYAEQAIGKEAGLRAIDEFAVGALMFDNSAPVAQSARLVPYSPEYRSVVMNKGAMLFHMLRAQMGDSGFKDVLHQFYAKYQGKTATIADFEALAVARGNASTKQGADPPNLKGFFAQWLNSTGIPEFSLDYVVYRTRKGFRVIGKIKQPIDTFSMPMQIRIDTEGNPETKTVEVAGTESPFEVETFGRPKPGGIHVDPNNTILKSTPALRARAAIARGEELAEVGKYYDAVQQYQRALSIQPNRSLANFRMGEAFFYQKNYQASANAFRSALETVPEPSEKWTEVWSHIYLGKIFDLLGQRERALHEYDKARQTNDNTGGAQQYVEALIKKPYTEGAQVQVSAPATGTPADSKGGNTDIPQPASGDKPVLKKPSSN
ncbi:MAG TPA: M1 family aminopeptidase [Candidatus Acidoferrales bacterium]|nr:M1 family aminopeptidase [Candidatus Acidoferrales bacterium]